MLQKIKAFLLLVGANPIVQWLFKVGRDSAVGFLATTPFAPTKAWALALATAVVSGVVHAFDIWLQQQIANAPSVVPTPAPSPVPVTPTQPTVSSHLSRLKATLKMTILLICGLWFVSQAAFAWELPGVAFNEKAKMKAIIDLNVSPALAGETDVILMPTANIGINVFTGTPSYGYTIDEALLIARVSPVDASHVEASSVIGATAGFYFDLGPWVASQGSQPWIVEGELGLIGPDFGTHLVPGIQFVYNFQTGERQALIDGSIDLSAIPSLPIIKVLGL